MGYDRGECILCYCRCGGNEECEDEQLYNLCYKCFTKWCPDGLRGNTGIGSYCQIAPDIVCDFCEQTSICLYQVAICDEHIKLINPNDHKLTSHVVDREICYGTCLCPECVRIDKKMHEYFIYQ